MTVAVWYAFVLVWFCWVFPNATDFGAWQYTPLLWQAASDAIICGNHLVRGKQAVVDALETSKWVLGADKLILIIAIPLVA